MMDRRIFVIGAMGTASSPLPAFAQARRGAGKIGYLHPVTISPSHETFANLQREWRRLGYVDGETLLARSAMGDVTLLPGLVSELIAERVGALVVVGADAVRAAINVPNAPPLVAIDLETDPIGAGMAASFSQPGGNMTGLFMDLPGIATKWIELLREVVPGMQRLVLVWQPSTGNAQLNVVLALARQTGLEVIVVETNAMDDFDAAFARIPGGPKSGLIQLTFPGLVSAGPRFSAAALRHGLPSIVVLAGLARIGALMSYGPNTRIYFPRAITIADQIIRGARPGDIPIEGPTHFELVVNLKTAAALGLTIPPSILIRADEVIE